jgi:hypothetical protein
MTNYISDSNKIYNNGSNATRTSLETVDTLPEYSSVNNLSQVEPTVPLNDARSVNGKLQVPDYVPSNSQAEAQKKAAEYAKIKFDMLLFNNNRRF